MTLIVPNFDDAIVVREADAEVLGMAQLSTRLLADSDATGERSALCARRWRKELRERGRTRIASQPNSSMSWMGNCNCS